MMVVSVDASVLVTLAAATEGVGSWGFSINLVLA